MSFVSGRYTILEPLGKGAMGTVYAAVHQGLRRRVAVKVLHSQHAGDEALKRRFAREAIAVSRLRSRYVVRVFDTDTTADGAPYIVMELLSGRDLAASIRSETASAEQVADWVIQICSAMEEAHRHGIIHRDLKPSNVFLAEPDGAVRVLDFGISRLVQGAELTAGSEILGTPNYIAPEVLQGRPADTRSDLYAIGVIAYRALTLRYPCQAETDSKNPFAALLATVTVPAAPIETHRPDVPEGMAAAVMRALAKDPDARFASAKAMADAFAPFASGRFPFEDVPASDSVPPVRDTSSFPPAADVEVDVQLAPEPARRVEPSPDGPTIVDGASSITPASIADAGRGPLARTAVLALIVVGALAAIGVVLARTSREPPPAPAAAHVPSAAAPDPGPVAGPAPAPTAAASSAPATSLAATAPRPNPASPAPHPSRTATAAPTKKGTGKPQNGEPLFIE